jgi:hypothetical protein
LQSGADLGCSALSQEFLCRFLRTDEDRLAVRLSILELSDTAGSYALIFKLKLQPALILRHISLPRKQANSRIIVFPIAVAGQSRPFSTKSFCNRDLVSTLPRNRGSRTGLTKSQGSGSN